MSTVDEHPTEALLDGRYRLASCVGRGGTALVYRAEDVLLGRTVAIKLLRQADEMPVEEERIRGESARLASLDHPSLVTLYDAKLDPGHPRYLVMEYVDGPTLSGHLTHGPLSSDEAADLAVDLAEALQAVHARGIIHRDVKPSNVLLTRDPQDRRWIAKLADFGIAYDPDDARLTSPGVAIGTAAYMAPEQVRAQELTPAADIYALGLVLIEVLAGRRAFPMTDGVQAALVRLTSSPSMPEDVDEAWIDLLTLMTDDEPLRRPTAAEVAQAAAALRGARSHVGAGVAAAGAAAGVAASGGAAGVRAAGGTASGGTASGSPAPAGEDAADADGGRGMNTATATAFGAAASADDEPGSTMEFPVPIGFAAATGAAPRRRRMRWLAALGAATAAIAIMWGTVSLLDPSQATDPTRTTPPVVSTPLPTPGDVSETEAPAEETDTVDADTVETQQRGADEKAAEPASNPNKGPGSNSGSGGDENSGNGDGNGNGNGKGNGR